MEEYFLGDVREVRYHHYYISYEYMTRGFCKITDKDLPSYSKSCDYISKYATCMCKFNKQTKFIEDDSEAGENLKIEVYKI